MSDTDCNDVENSLDKDTAKSYETDLQEFDIDDETDLALKQLTVGRFDSDKVALDPGCKTLLDSSGIAKSSDSKPKKGTNNDNEEKKEFKNDCHTPEVESFQGEDSDSVRNSKSAEHIEDQRATFSEDPNNKSSKSKELNEQEIEHKTNKGEQQNSSGGEREDNHLVPIKNKLRTEQTDRDFIDKTPSSKQPWKLTDCLTSETLKPVDRKPVATLSHNKCHPSQTKSNEVNPRLEKKTARGKSKYQYSSNSQSLTGEPSQRKKVVERLRRPKSYSSISSTETLLSGYIRSSNVLLNHNSGSRPKTTAKKRYTPKLKKHTLEDVVTLVSKDLNRTREICDKHSGLTVKDLHFKGLRAWASDNNMPTTKSDSTFSSNTESEVSVALGSEQKPEVHHDGGPRAIVKSDFNHDVRLLRRLRPRLKRRQAYDAANSTTRLILLNNTYGQNTHLWKIPRPYSEKDRRCLVDPKRHSKEISFYLPGNFHDHCSESPPPDKFRSHSKLTFTFPDRPSSDRIGDRLYEAKTAVNQRRHRTCRPERKPSQMDFSPPIPRSLSNTYVFEWERLYSDPPFSIIGLNSARPSTRERELTKIPPIQHMNRPQTHRVQTR